jgi:hypothetical protein
MMLLNTIDLGSQWKPIAKETVWTIFRVEEVAGRTYVWLRLGETTRELVLRRETMLVRFKRVDA